MKQHATPRDHRLLIWFIMALLLCITTGCTSIDHVARYREARDLYNEATTNANEITFNSVWPDTPRSRYVGADGKLDYRLSTGLALSDYEDIASRYIESAAIARNLSQTQSTRNALAADNLLGATLALEALSTWKAAFYYQLQAIEFGDESVNPVTIVLGENDPITYNLSDAQSMADARTRARTVLGTIDNAGLPLYARDRFLLQAIPALSRYDNAYIHAIRMYRNGTLTKAKLVEVMEEMAKAEKHLDHIAKQHMDRPEFQAAAVVTRYLMLRTATKLGFEMIDLFRTDGKLWSEQEALTLLPMLIERHRQFIDLVASNNDSAEKHFFTTYAAGEAITGTNHLPRFYRLGSGD